MLTPAFKLEQDENFLTVTIRAPFAKVAETEIFIEDDDFKFFSKPYFLRLCLPGHIVEDGREKADYNFDTGEFTVVVPKKTPGEHFEGLDMLTKLLAPKSKNTPSNLIEVLDTSTEAGDECDFGDDFDWCVEQVPYVEPSSAGEAVKYGFASQKSGVFQRLQEDMVCIVDCPDPDRLTVSERRKLRLQAEWEKFDEDHYISDLYEDDMMQTFLDYCPCWCEELSAGKSKESEVIFTEEEQEVMRKLPRKEYLLEKAEEMGVYLGLVDILYAYAYNHRTTEGETHCESGWTICKISATLSWLEVFASIQDVMKSCFRRSLSYPLYRHWKLNQKVLEDVVHLLKCGPRRLLKILLEIRGILMDQDCRYVLNDLYITDYCVWIQSASSKRLQSLAEAVLKVNLTKDDIGFNLPEIEKLAKEALKGEKDSSDIDSLVEKLNQVVVGENSYSDNHESPSEYETDSDDVTAESDDVTSDSSDSTAESDGVIAISGDVTAKSDDVTAVNNLSKTLTGEAVIESKGGTEICVLQGKSEDLCDLDAQISDENTVNVSTLDQYELHKKGQNISKFENTGILQEGSNCSGKSKVLIEEIS